MSQIHVQAFDGTVRTITSFVQIRSNLGFWIQKLNLTNSVFI